MAESALKYRLLNRLLNVSPWLARLALSAGVAALGSGAMPVHAFTIYTGVDGPGPASNALNAQNDFLAAVTHVEIEDFNGVGVGQWNLMSNPIFPGPTTGQRSQMQAPAF